MLFVFEIAHDLGDAKNPHGDNDEIDAITQGRNAKGEALRARGEVGADEAQQEAKQHHAEGLDEGGLRQHDGGDEP